MSSREWKLVYRTIKEAARRMSRPRRRPEYGDTLIVAVYLWAVMQDRPQGWACRRENYQSIFRPRALPSESRLSRRIRGERCQMLLTRVYEEVAEVDRPSSVNMVDGRPFTVNGCTKDRQARPGRISGGFARGYRLHSLVSDDRRVLNWMVTPMNEPEPAQAKTLIETAAAVGEVILGDSVYDANSLYKAAKARGSVLVSHIRADRLKNRPRTNRNSPERIAAVESWKRGVARYVYRDRVLVETTFGNQSSYAGGLGPLPAWVRTLPRVTRWIGAKLILYHARLRCRTHAGPS
jgi:hypothetical protein